MLRPGMQKPAEQFPLIASNLKDSVRAYERSVITDGGGGVEGEETERLVGGEPLLRHETASVARRRHAPQRVRRLHRAVGTAGESGPGVEQGAERVGVAHPLRTDSLLQPSGFRGEERRLHRGGDSEPAETGDVLPGEDRGVLYSQHRRVGAPGDQRLQEIEHPAVGAVADGVDRHPAAETKCASGHVEAPGGIEPIGAPLPGQVGEPLTHRRGVAAEAAVGEHLHAREADPPSGRADPLRRRLQIPRVGCGHQDAHRDREARRRLDHDVEFCSGAGPVPGVGRHHGSDPGEADRGETGGGAHQVVRRHRRRQRAEGAGDRFDCRLAEDAGEAAGGIPVHRPAAGVGGVVADPGQGERRRVGHRHVGAVADHQHRTIGGDPVEEVAIGEPALGERLVVESERGEGGAGGKEAGGIAEDVGDGGEIGRLLQRGSQQDGGMTDRVEVGVAESGNDRRSGKTLFGEIGGAEVSRSPHRGDAVAGDEDGIAAHPGVVAYHIGDDETAEHAVRLTAIVPDFRNGRPWRVAQGLAMVCSMKTEVLSPEAIGPESIREIVFGVEDGVVQNMTLIAGMIGAGLSHSVIVLAGAINAVAGVLSMSMGTYLSSQAERDALRAAARATAAVRSPMRDAVVMAAAYAAGAMVPLLPFAVPFLSRGAAVLLAVTLTAATLFALGVLKAIVGRGPRLRSGLRLMVLASAAGAAGYLIGLAAQAVFNLEV